MKNVTIGDTQANWQAARLARYYAVRCDETEYSFGATPADALANLEKRDRTLQLAPDGELSEEIAFLALGAGEYLRRVYSPRDLDKFGGYMGIINEVVRCAPLLAARSRQLAGDFDGVWLYDVTERFGRQWTEALLAGGSVRPEAVLEYVIADEMGKGK